MNLHSLKPAAKSTKNSKRIGRGQGSGKGGTSTKGHKGAQSRSGYSRKIGFEGGQMPIYRILPKRGFKNRNRIAYNAINLSTLQILSEKTGAKEVDLELLMANGLAKKKSLIKVLAKGELTAKLTVAAHAFSAAAKTAIENAGGKVVTLLQKAEIAEPVAESKQAKIETENTEE
ncbi:MAG: 50S ribosomal protein L15 [Bacteroidales bacterium]|jgi:large subunit ribosomal protein L15|nr:50S ribosomal protein L15 [Bacteroidales bacterium]